MRYISLFSSAGVGCYGFKMAGFDCVATNEYIPRRLEVQKYNKKCKYESGYICGDITTDEIKNKLYSEINLWKQKEKMDRVDVVIATPPCQGMSVANHKKKDTEIIRNSLVVESIKLIKTIKPRFFIFENVPSFMKTICTDIDGVDKKISEAIELNLGGEYSYTSRVLNFKNYGSNSSRQRTLVIGVASDMEDDISPYELYPDYTEEKTLREVIGDLPTLSEMGEITPNDIYHSFRSYPEYMREWIADLKEGQSAFDNDDIRKKPHQIKDGEIILNQNKNGDKYTRQYWNKVGPCIHTRNDQLASQSTIHPEDDRVFSVRELMRMMTVPSSFNWTSKSLDELNSMTEIEKKGYLKQDEIKIRQSLGEAVPTEIFHQIAEKIKTVLSFPKLKNTEINKIINDNNFIDEDLLCNYITNNPNNLSIASLSKIAELTNTNRTENNAFYTNKALITEMVNRLPNFEKDEIHILEPSVGVANFVPIVAKRYDNKKIIFDLVDIDHRSISIAKVLIGKEGLSDNVSINYITDDFLTHEFKDRYDLVIGNPPFGKIKGGDKHLQLYKKEAINKDTNNICSFFLDKMQKLGSYIAIVFPKFLLNTPEFKASREYLCEKHIDAIIDFGEKGFPGVLIETIGLMIETGKKSGNTFVKSIPEKIELTQKQSYICDKKLPYWLIYRNKEFDTIYRKMDFGLFDVVRDRQITNSMLNNEKKGLRVIKSRNISDDGKEILDIHGYDSYITVEKAKGTAVYEYLNKNGVYITPNMTYYPRVMKKPMGTMINGSVAILIPKTKFVLTEKQRAYFSSVEFRYFYRIARNYQTRSLNVDLCSVYFFGVLKKEQSI